jgi:metal-dependent amidase/aminoacylase/carboxypeptidase family protein
MAGHRWLQTISVSCYRDVPGAYIWLGARDEHHREHLHSPLYDFNDGILEIGARYWVKLIETALPCHKTHAAALSAV